MTVSRKKILFVEASNYWGAPEHLLYELLTNDVLRNNIDVVAALTKGPVFDKFVKARYFNVFPISAQKLSKSKGIFFILKSLMLIIKTCWELFRLIKQERPDVIQANSTHAAVYSAVIAKIMKVPLIWHVHDIYKRDVLNTLLIRCLAFLANKIIAVSEATRQGLCRMNVQGEKITVVHNGLNQEIWKPLTNSNKLRDRWGIPIDAIVFMHIGRITRWKGQHVFLNAASKIKYQNTVFLVVGGPGEIADDKIYETEIIEQIKNIGNRAKYISWLNDPITLYAIADIVVHSSILEDPFPTVVLEAMSLGKPVIASNLGGAKEAIENGISGIIFSPYNEKELVKAMTKLIESTDLRLCMGNEAIKRFRNKFTLIHQIHNLINLYEKID